MNLESGPLKHINLLTHFEVCDTNSIKVLQGSKNKITLKFV